MEEKQMSVTCTWIGGNDDILITNKGFGYTLYDKPTERDKMIHGVSYSGSMSMSKLDAKKFMKEISDGLRVCQDLDDSYEGYMTRGQLWDYDGELDRYLQK
jgi:hypothetical protein